jgi:hypothetical protein
MALTAWGLGLGALPWVLWHLAAATTVALSAMAITSRSLLRQVIARGVVWSFFLGALLIRGLGDEWSVLRGAVVALSLAGLLLAAPGMHTGGARAQFDPIAYRRPFLAGAIAAACVGFTNAFGAVWQLVAVARGHATGVPAEVWGPALLAVACIASAVGVVRMRAWGVLLAAAAALGSIACALPVWRHVSLVGLGFACLPGLLLTAPVVASRFARTAPPRPPVRVRVATEPDRERDEAPADDVTLDEGDAAAAYRVAASSFE